MDSVRALTPWVVIVTWAAAAICYAYSLIFSTKKKKLVTEAASLSVKESRGSSLGELSLGDLADITFC